jgi:hypothetical protein
MNVDMDDASRSAFPLPRWAGRCALLVVGLVAGLLLTELALRVIGLGHSRPAIFHPYRGIASQPHAVFDYVGEGRSQTIQFNSRGFRDINRSPAKPSGVYRIAVLGDSYIEAPQVAVADRVTEQLEAELNRWAVLAPLQVEVLNFGFSAYGTMQELQVLKHDVWQFHPDLVILAFLTGNDVQNNCRELQDEKNRPYLELRAGEFREVFPIHGEQMGWPESRLLGLWNKIRYQRLMLANRQAEASRYRIPDGPDVRGIEAGLNLGIYVPPSEPAWEHGWQITEELLRRFHQECLAHDTDWLLVVLSNGVQTHPDRELRESFRRVMRQSTLLYPEERLQETALRDGYRILCLAPRMCEIAERDRVFLHGFDNMQLGFGHWNEQGHRVAAKLIADSLQGSSTTVGQRSRE